MIIQNDMVILKIVEDKTALEVYVNSDNKIYMCMYDEENPEDYFRMQSLVLDKNDAQALVKELQRLLSEYEIA